MMKMMIVLNKHVDSAECSLSSIELGVTMKKYRPITTLSNICKYRPVPNPNTSIVLTLPSCIPDIVDS